MNRFGFFYTPVYPNRVNENMNDTYIVQKGDSLYKISQKYNVDVNDLIKYNDLKSSLIYPGQIIVIPIKGMNGATYFEEYLVGEGDTIENISNKTGTSASDIAKYNDITKLLLKESQAIKLPYGYKEYEIVATDSLDYILRKFNMTAEELIEANKDKWLRIGNIINVKN